MLWTARLFDGSDRLGFLMCVCVKEKKGESMVSVFHASPTRWSPKLEEEQKRLNKLCPMVQCPYQKKSTAFCGTVRSEKVWSLWEIFKLRKFTFLKKPSLVSNPPLSQSPAIVNIAQKWKFFQSSIFFFDAFLTLNLIPFSMNKLNFEAVLIQKSWRIFKFFKHSSAFYDLRLFFTWNFTYSKCFRNRLPARCLIGLLERSVLFKPNTQERPATKLVVRGDEEIGNQIKNVVKLKWSCLK